MSRFILPTFVLSAALVIPAGALEAATKTIKATIDFSKPAQISDQVQELAGALGGEETTIYLDLTVIPGGADSAPDYRVTRTIAASGKSAKVKCDDGWQRFSGATSSFSFEFNPDYNHLLLQILHSGPAQAPFTTAACEYRGASGDIPVFTIQGYYAKSAIGIPTADDIELRPVTPTISP
ncbi:MAG: hypothetical protein U1E67_19125 [Hyphomicrobiales bacterium]